MVVSNKKSFDVVVVGGGPIGLATAWRAAQAGMEVAVFDAGLMGAFNAAAGMLAPVTEAHFGEGGLLELNVRSAEMYPEFCRELVDLTEAELGYRRVGTLTVARDGDDMQELERLLAFRQKTGLCVDRVTPTQVRALEPAIAPTIRMGLVAETDHSIEPIRLVHALKVAAQKSGAEIYENSPVGQVSTDAGRIVGIELANGECFKAANVVVAAGSWSNQIGGIPTAGQLPLRPVKGQTITLIDKNGSIGTNDALRDHDSLAGNFIPEGDSNFIARTVRTTHSYLVARAQRRYLLGGTVEERGFDEYSTVLATFELIRDMSEVVPAVLELAIEDLNVGFRPALPDNLPAIGFSEIDGLVWATGHFRNGILLTPLTALWVVDLLLENDLPDCALVCAPSRFAGAKIDH